MWDDGRVIAPMGDVYSPHSLSLLPPRITQKHREREKAAQATAQKYVAMGENAPMSKKEQRIVVRAMTLAYMSAFLLIAGGFAAILLLCQYVWFK